MRVRPPNPVETRRSRFARNNGEPQAIPVIEEVVDVSAVPGYTRPSPKKPNTMAKTRVFTNPGTGAQTGVYHVVSRFVDRRKVFGDEEREVFRAMMGEFAAFHQVEILTF